MNFLKVQNNNHDFFFVLYNELTPCSWPGGRKHALNSVFSDYGEH